MPIVTLPRAILALLSWLILAAGAYLVWEWYQGHDFRDLRGYWHHVRGPLWWLSVGVGFLSWSFLGRSVVLMCLPAKPNEPREERADGRTITAPDGSAIRIETRGPHDAPTLVLTHGWGLNSTAWWYANQTLAKRFRVVTWDLPGLGRSRPPPDGRLTIDRLAQALGAVVETSANGPIILVGHSIGGMATQTFWRTAPQGLKDRVAGMVLLDTTHKDPLQTMWLSPLWRALRWPLIEPMCWLSIALSPLAWLSAWQGYLNGSSQLAMRLTGFGHHATRGQVDFTARLSAKGSPAIQAKGNLAMFRWRATEVLPTILIPVLVIVGDSDIITLPSASETIEQSAPEAQLVRVSGAGHMGFMEQSEVYDRHIADFAEQVFSRRKPKDAGA